MTLGWMSALPLQNLFASRSKSLPCLQAVSWFRGANASAGGRWEGLLRVERPSVLPVGVRCVPMPSTAS